MKSSIQISKSRFGGLVFALLSLISISTADAQIYVDSFGTISEYNSSTGALINASLIPGSGETADIATSGNNLFVGNSNGDLIGEYSDSGATINSSLIDTNNNGGSLFFVISGTDIFATTFANTISEYTTSGGTVNSALISGLDEPHGIAVSGSDLFVANFNGSIGEYTTSGEVVNASLITDLTDPNDLTISGGDLFVSEADGFDPSPNQVGEYTTSGAAVNASLITGVTKPYVIAVSGNDLYIANGDDISEYTTSGELINATFITGLNAPFSFAVASVPEPSTWTMILGGFGLLAFFRYRKSQR